MMQSSAIEREATASSSNSSSILTPPKSDLCDVVQSGREVPSRQRVNQPNPTTVFDGPCG